MSFSEITAMTELVLARAGFAQETEAECKFTQEVDSFTDDEIDGLPFGVIQLDLNGTILKYNMFEAGLAGLDRGSVIGRNYFADIAPCTAVKEFHERFQRGVRGRNLHEKFNYHFAFPHKPVDVTITLFYSEISSTIWVFTQPLQSTTIV